MNGTRSLVTAGAPGFSLESMAGGAMIRSSTRIVFRLPVKFRPDLEAVVKSNRMTGRMAVDYTQGVAADLSWE